MINFFRWVAILPVAFVSAIVLPVLLRVLTNIGFLNYRGGEPLPFYIELAISVVMGATFVSVGKLMAPSNKEKVGKILFYMSIIVFAGLFIFNWQQGERMAALYCLPSLVGAYLAMDYDV
ncbi:hypothetical protein [Proteus terrae]|uniref:hypothetical protein n=1 Tax=Proteus terrae TaxID=1574161 RepID=UPI000D695ADA|nr:hypothetical protein [Proteus terrae]